MRYFEQHPQHDRRVFNLVITEVFGAGGDGTSAEAVVSEIDEILAVAANMYPEMSEDVAEWMRIRSVVDERRRSHG